MKLVIVESPTKARTIERYLGEGFKVLSSYGHVRDLPERELGVDIEHDFEPKLVVTNKKSLPELKKAVGQAEVVYLATDNDREGEAIAFDLYEVLNHKHDTPYERVVFNEITKSVIQQAIEHPNEIDRPKVEAQRARRILDRLVGYLISPLMSKSLASNRFEGLSAGRVQSVALRLIADRELEIQAFEPQEYWTIDAKVAGDSEFVAELSRVAEEKPKVPDKDEADRIGQELHQLAQDPGLTVSSMKESETTRSPSPPFITSTLQQTASSMLRFTPKKTMQIAQQLYEGVELESGHEGLITYMRTDSLRIAEGARDSARDLIQSSFGENYLSEKPRTFKNKKAAQDAHEAIRPTDVNRTPEDVKPFLKRDQHRLYKLIWERFTATQMAEARYNRREVTLTAGDYQLRARGSTLVFDGFLKVWEMPPLKDEGIEIPDLNEGDVLTLKEVLPEQHFTEPPKRFSEASLVKDLEDKEIGRPSTYASIVSTIQDRNYVGKAKGGSLRPTLLGFIATDFLKTYFPLTVEEQFTAHMEEELDKVSEGGRSRVEVLQEFYGPLSKRLTQVEEELAREERKFRILTDVSCPKCGSAMEVRFWKGSAFLGCSQYPDCKQTIDFPYEQMEYEYRDRTVIVEENLQHHRREKEQLQAEMPERTCPECGAQMQLKDGRYGRFWGCTNYPDCKTTEPVSTDVACPRCGRDIVERYSRKRRKPFYGCSGFPDCNFAVNQKPVRLCSECDDGVLVELKEKLACSNRNCGHEEALPDAEAASTA